MKSKILALASVIALIGVMIPTAAFAATLGSSDGTFSLDNVAPTLASVELYSDSGLTTVATNLDPQTTYYAKVSVGDANMLSDLTQIKVTLKYFAAASTPSGDPSAEAADTQSEIHLTCTVSGPTFAIDGGAGTSWAVGVGSSQPAVLTVTSGDWKFAFVPGKVANQAAGGVDANAGWGVYAKVVDSGALSAAAWWSSGSNTKKGMSWYGEVTGVTSSVSFAGGLGATDQQCAAPISVTYISNGNYKEQIKTDDGSGAAQWKSGGNVVTLLETGAAPGAGQMRLKGYYDTTLGSAATVKQSTYVDLASTGALTSESGTARATNTLWLSLGSSGITSGTYTGKIYYQIASRP